MICAPQKVRQTFGEHISLTELFFFFNQNSTINYLKPAKTNYVLAKGELIKQGKTTAYIQAKIYDENEKLIAVMDANYFYIG